MKKLCLENKIKNQLNFIDLTGMQTRESYFLHFTFKNCGGGLPPQFKSMTLSQ